MGSASQFKPELASVIRSLVDSMLLDLNVCMPAKIVTYNPLTQYADVQIQLFQGFSDGSLVPYPIIPNVPVKHPRAFGGKAFMHMPLVIGDDVLLVFSQRSIDNWKTQGVMSDPDDLRKHHITDAFALIGGSGLPEAFSVSNPLAIEIVNGLTKVDILPTGQFSVKNSIGELISVLDQISQKVETLAQTLSTDTVNTIFGPVPLNSFVEYATLATELTALIVELETFKGP